MILRISVVWRCDDCGYEKLEHYGPEDTNTPTIQCLPPGWDHRSADVVCSECSS